MYTDKRKMAWIVAIAAGVILLLLIVWPSRRGARTPSGPEFPPELAEAIRDGIAMTREARRDALDGMVSAQRWRLLATVIGASIPIVVAYLALRLASTKDPDEADVMARMIEESELISRRTLRDIERKKLKESKSLSVGRRNKDDDPQDNPADSSDESE